MSFGKSRPRRNRLGGTRVPNRRKFPCWKQKGAEWRHLRKRLKHQLKELEPLRGGLKHGSGMEWTRARKSSTVTLLSCPQINGKEQRWRLSTWECRHRPQDRHPEEETVLPTANMLLSGSSTTALKPSSNPKTLWKSKASRDPRGSGCHRAAPACPSFAHQAMAVPGQALACFAPFPALAKHKGGGCALLCEAQGR